MSKLLLDDFIARNPDSLVTITHDTVPKITLAGILSDSQLVQSLQASYGNSIWGDVSSMADSMSSYGKEKGKKLAKVTGTGLNAVKSFATNRHTLMGTVKTYEGSGDIVMPINMTCFYDWGGNPSFKQVETWINLMTQPKIESGLMGSNLYSPEVLLKLATLNTNLFDGELLNVRIGNWMLATDVFAININKNYITNTNEDGKPIAIQLSFQISPYRQLSAEELSNWIL